MGAKLTVRDESFGLLRPLPPSVVIVGLLGCMTIVGVAAGLARLFMGLGQTTALTDAYPWGIWIGFDFALIAFSGAGFTMAALVHVLHFHRFAPALRPALLAGLLGYTAVLLLLVLDLGRPDRFYHFLLYWNGHSPLFEISWCVLLYSTVLVIEVSPDVFGWLRWKKPARWALLVMAPVTIIGVTLSTLHQSTLGTLYLMMPHRLDWLWYSPILPLLFFTSSVMAGLSLAILAYRVAMRAQGKAEQPSVIEGLAVGVVIASAVYLTLRLGALAWAGWQAQGAADAEMLRLLAAELTIGVLIPGLLLLVPAWRRMSAVQWLAPILVLAGVGMNRFNATLYAQTPTVTGMTYEPHLFEWLSTFGILAGVALAWYLGVKFIMVEKRG